MVLRRRASRARAPLQIEGENHFFFQCQEYSSLRKVLLNQINGLSILTEITQGESTIRGITPIRHLLYTILERVLRDKHNDHCTA